MATKIEEILGRDINSLKELREEIKRLQDSIANVDPTTQEFTDTTKKLVAAQEQLTSVTKASKDESLAAKDSIVGMEREYRNLYNTYKMFTEEQRNSPMGKDMAAQLDSLSTKLNETKKNVGNFKDNIGRYAESAMEAFGKMGGSVGGLVGPFKTASSGIKAFNATLAANPVMAVVTLVMKLVSAISQLTSATNEDEEGQMQLNEAFAAFRPIVDGVTNAVTALGKILVKIVDAAGKATTAIRKFFSSKEGKKAIEEQEKMYKELAKSQNELIKNKREYEKLNEAENAEVQRLREEASEAASLEEKRKLLTEAKEKQAEIDQRNIEIAEEELRILEEQAKLTANDAAMNDKLAAATARVSEAQATAAKNMKQFNRELGSGGGGGAGAVKNYREEAKKLYEETVENSKSEVTKLTEKYKKEKKLLEKYHFDTKLLTKQYNKEMAKLYEEAAKTAAEKASAKYVAVEKSRIDKYDSLLANVVQREIDDTIEVLKTEAKKKSFDKFFNDFMGLSFNSKEAVEQGKQFINEINEILGTQIQFPPELDKKSMSEFKARLKLAKNEFEVYVDEMKATAKKADIEESMLKGATGYVQRMRERINLIMTTNDSDESFVREKMAALDREEVEMEAQKWSEIMNIENLSYQERYEAAQNFYASVSQLREWEYQANALDAERTAAIWESAFDNFDGMTSAIQTITNSYSQLINAQLQDGKITEKEAKKKKKTLENLEKVALAVNIAQIAASTAAGIMGVWESYGQELALNAETAAATGPAAAATKAALDAKSLAAAIIRTVTIGTTGAANIAAASMGTIAKLHSMSESESGGGSAGVAASVQPIDSTPYSYTRTVQTAEEEDALYKKNYWVSVSDIESGLDHHVKVTDESSF